MTNKEAANETSKKWYHPRIWWVYIPLAIFAIVILAFNIFQPITVLPRMDLGPGYLLHNQDGEKVTNEDYRGQLSLYSFTYTNCDNCSQSLDDIAHIQTFMEENVPPDVNISHVTISLDPERDTPEQMKAALAKYNVADDNVDWEFISGDPLITKYAVGSGFGFYYGANELDADGDYDVTFQPRYFLLDGWGIIRTYYGVAAPSTEILLRDINLITEEIKNSEGVASLGYEAAHLFLCYP